MFVTLCVLLELNWWNCSFLGVFLSEIFLKRACVNKLSFCADEYLDYFFESMTYIGSYASTQVK